MSKPGKPFRWTPQTEQDHFIRCPICHKWFDMRKLEEAFEHVHDGVEVLQEQEKGGRHN
jgi:hypothetical protein